MTDVERTSRTVILEDSFIGGKFTATVERVVTPEGTWHEVGLEVEDRYGAGLEPDQARSFAAMIIAAAVKAERLDEVERHRADPDKGAAGLPPQGNAAAFGGGNVPD